MFYSIPKYHLSSYSLYHFEGTRKELPTNSYTPVLNTHILTSLPTIVVSRLPTYVSEGIGTPRASLSLITKECKAFIGLT